MTIKDILKLMFLKLLFTTGPVTSGGNLVVGLVCLSRPILSVTAARNFLILSMIMSYDVELMPHPVISNFWYCLVSQTHRHFYKNVPFSKKGSHVIRVGNSNTAANIHGDLLLLLTHYEGMLAHCKRVLEWLACCFKHTVDACPSAQGRLVMNKSKVEGGQIH